MIKYRLISKNNDWYVYEYYSCYEEDKGIVEFNFIEGKLDIKKKCETVDVSEVEFYYALKRRLDEKRLDDEGLIAWY